MAHGRNDTQGSTDKIRILSTRETTGDIVKRGLAGTQLNTIECWTGVIGLQKWYMCRSQNRDLVDRRGRLSSEGILLAQRLNDTERSRDNIGWLIRKISSKGSCWQVDEGRDTVRTGFVDA